MVTGKGYLWSRRRSGDRRCPAGAYLASFYREEQRHTPA
jgi:hypothetical protein